jgi:hypothetical protein
MSEQTAKLKAECQQAAGYLAALFTSIRKHRNKSPFDFEEKIAKLLERDIDLESKRDGLLMATDMFVKTTYNLPPEVVEAVDADLQSLGLKTLSAARASVIAAPPVPDKPDLPPYADAFFNAIREKSKTDPLIGAKIGAKEVFQRLLEVLKNERGVHAESLLTALGALAGYACQAALRAQATAKGLDETSSLVVVEMQDGSKYFYGDPLNDLLIGTQYSVWGLVGGAAQQLGVTELPDLNEMFSHVTTVLGTDQFGIPRVPSAHRAADHPIDYLRALWKPLHPIVRIFCPEPSHWPILYGLAVQEAMTAGKDAIAPRLAFVIVMESAIAMSKIDLMNISASRNNE